MRRMCSDVLLCYGAEDSFSNTVGIYPGLSELQMTDYLLSNIRKFFFCLEREDVSLNKFWSDLLKSLWHFYSTNLVSYSNAQIFGELKGFPAQVPQVLCAAQRRTTAEGSAKWREPVTSLKMLLQRFSPVRRLLWSAVGRPVCRTATGREPLLQHVIKLWKHWLCTEMGSLSPKNTVNLSFCYEAGFILL